MNAPGSLKGTLLVSPDDRVHRATVGYQPIADPGPVLEERAPEDAVRMIDVLYGVCRYAHGLAARRAMGVSIDLETEWRLECAVCAEAAREALLLTGWHWPRLLNVEALPVQLIQGAISLLQATQRADRDALGTLVVEQHGDITEFLQLSLGQTVALQQGRVSFDAPEHGWLMTMLTAIDSATDPALPMPEDVLHATPRDCFLGALGRHFAAMQTLQTLVQRGSAAITGRSAKTGSADVTTCRGRLTHTVSMGPNQQVASYRVDAPTTRRFASLEWTRPGLEQLKQRPARQAEIALGNWLAALDPCGGVFIERGTAHA